jgi:hypothetical protein
MLPVSMWVLASCSSLLAPTATCNRFAGFPLLRKIYMRLPIGCSGVECDPLRWSERAFTGFRSIRFWRLAASRSAARAEARSKTAPKTATDKTETAAGETKKSAQPAPKPAEPKTQEAPRNGSLFDTEAAPLATSVPVSDEDDEEEILAEAGEQDSAEEGEESDEAA